MPTSAISVVIPAYNRAATIGYCLDSVCKQTLLPREIIVVDDCSSDETVTVVNSFSRANPYPSIKCITLDRHSGAQAARNRGILEADASWIAFQDSDDEWLPDKLARQVSILESYHWHERVVVHGDMIRFYPRTGVKKLWSLPRVDGRHAYKAVLTSPGPTFPTMLVAKSALLEIGLLDEKVPSYQEWDTCIRLARTCEFVHIGEPLVVYWLHEGETISKDKQRDVEGYHYIIDKHRKEMDRVIGAPGRRRHVLRLLKGYCDLGRLGDAKALMRELHFFSLTRLIAEWRMARAIMEAR